MAVWTCNELVLAGDLVITQNSFDQPLRTEMRRLQPSNPLLYQSS
jgi:hypothetical protein